VSRGEVDGFGRYGKVKLGEGIGRTSATGAESSISVGPCFADSGHLAVDVLGVIGVDVAGAAATVGNCIGHGDCVK
jgi:hypothetical protein